ncbi:MAG: tRNA (N(6)-L-threonylcarbamoyladenosine(37)-C(2))-methylthiotransferase MtaB [Malacoplasma sp.]|nr:tRNA (N(6)-L-threonylcarbamoyladenosine(37)-C(2))-methylthiotransferase MtaB [Malacoplasma sp.]
MKNLNQNQTQLQKINTFAIHTLGCKVNLFESNVIRNDLLLNGLVEVPFDSKADVYIINTCSVTNKADSKSKLYIRKASRTNKNGIVVVAGCMSQINKDLMKELKIDIQIGNKFKYSIYDLLLNYSKNKEKILKIENLLKEKTFEKNESISFKENTRAFIKIQDGCNFMCSYCIIPFSRGRQRSNDLQTIINEIETLVDEGFKEIVLTGVNTAGFLDKDKNNFFDLLFAINKIKKDFRVRVSSVEPFQINDKIVNLIASNPNRFCQHWHICLQSGSDSVLTKMNRRYTVTEYEQLINKIRAINPNTLFTTDYIVGFPSENEDDHLKSINFLKKIKFFDMHIFPYSKRVGTKSSNYKDIHDATKKERFKNIAALNFANKFSILKSKINQELEVIFEHKNPNDKYYSGYSSEYCRVFVESENPLENKIYKVKIQKVLTDGLFGIIQS